MSQLRQHRQWEHRGAKSVPLDRVRRLGHQLRGAPDWRAVLRRLQGAAPPRRTVADPATMRGGQPGDGAVGFGIRLRFYGSGVFARRTEGSRASRIPHAATASGFFCIDRLEQFFRCVEAKRLPPRCATNQYHSGV